MLQSINQVHCKRIDPVWQEKAPTHLEGTCIWKIKRLENYADANGILSQDEQTKALRFHRSKDRDSFICRRTALRILLSQYIKLPPAEIEFNLGQNKKPELRSPANLSFNVSHSEEMILIAISDKAVGIDIEYIRPEFNFREVLNHSFSEQEIRFINESKEQTNCFFELWTRKEALTKASSKGLDDELRDIPVLDGWHNLNKKTGLNNSLQLNSFSIDHEYAASIAFVDKQNLSFFDFKFL